MRLFIKIFSFINIILYYAAYAYFDNIISALAHYNLSTPFLDFLRFIIVFILGFMIGLLIIINMKPEVSMNYFDIRTFLIAGSIPAVALILYKSGLVNLAVDRLFNSNLTVSELAFYFFSRETVWAIWLGFAAGASVRLGFKTRGKKFKHQVSE